MVTNEDGFGMREIGERHFVEKDGALRPQTNMFPEPGKGQRSPGTVFLGSKCAEVTWTSLWDPAENQS